MYVCTYECVGILKHIQTEARKKWQCFYEFNLFMTIYFL